MLGPICFLSSTQSWYTNEYTLKSCVSCDVSELLFTMDLKVALKRPLNAAVLIFGMIKVEFFLID